MLFASLASKEDCFQKGECRESSHITGAFVSDEFACLDFCKSGIITHSNALDCTQKHKHKDNIHT